MAKSPQLNVFGRQTETTVRPFDAPAAPDPAPGSLGEIFQRGIESGTAGLEADLDYFRALANTLTGDKEAAEINVANARIDESLSAAPLQGIAEFGEFLDAPTFSGLIEQAVLAGGQVVPSALTTIAGAGVGGLAGAAVAGGAKLALRGATKQAAERVVKDSLERTVKGVADPEEQLLAELSFRQAKRAFAAGAFTGAGTAEYVPLAGSNLSEALDAGLELTPEQAARAAGVALPQALIGVGSEAALLKLVGSVAGKRATKEGGVFSTLAKDIASRTAGGAALESATEGLQESIAIANRQDLDPTFSDEDANLRRMQAIFAGAIGGGAAAGAGSAVVGSASAAVRSVTDGSLLDATANVTAKARELLDRAQRQRMDAKVDEEQYNVVMSGMTTPESQADINAQLNAMLDPSSSKQAVWVAGTEPQYNAPVNKSRPIQVDGNLAYAAFVPGQGTIVSTSRTIVDEVVAAGASDAALAAALGYSKPKDAADPSDIVVQVLDSQGGVVSEEAVGNAPEDFEAAMQAASKIMPNGGSLRQTTVEKALEERAQRAAKERGPDIRPMEVKLSRRTAEGVETVEAESFDIDNMPQQGGYDPALVEREAARAREALARSRQEAASRRNRAPLADQFAGARDAGLVEQEAASAREALGKPQQKPSAPSRSGPKQSFLGAGVADIATFGRKRQPDVVFSNTQAARDAFEEAFADPNTPTDISPEGVFVVPSEVVVNGESLEISWDNPVFAGMTEAMLRRAASEQKGRTDSVVEIIADENGYTLQRRDFDEQGFTLTDERGNKKTLPLEQFLAEAVRVAGRSRFARDSKLTIKAPNGRVTRVNPVDLTRAGQRLRETTDNAQFSDSGREGLMALLAELLNNGYDVQIEGTSINTPEGARLLQRSDLTADLGKGPTRTLGGMMGPTAEQRRPQVRGRVRETDGRSTLRVYSMDAYGNVDYSDLVFEETASDAELDVIEQTMDEQNLASNERSTLYFERTPVNLDIAEQESFQGEGTENLSANAQSTQYDQPDGLAGPRGAKDSVGPAISKMTREVVSDLLKALGLKNPPRVFLFEDGRVLALRNGEAVSLEPRQLSRNFVMQKALAEAIGNLNTNRDLLAQHVTVGDEKIILFRESRNPLQNALVMGHELGHSLFKEEQDKLLANPALRKRLFAAYNKSPAFKELSERYGYDDGFEEWYADQVSLWASKRYKERQARNMVEKHFKDFVDRLRKLWRTLSASLRKRFEGGVTQDFESYVEATIQRRNSQRNLNGPPTTAKSLPYQINEIVQETGGKALAMHWRKRIQDLLKNPNIRPLMKIIRTADGIMRMHAGQKIADMFYVRSQDREGGGRLGMIGAFATKVREMTVKFQEEIGNFDDPEVEKAFKLVVSDKATAELEGKARQIREYLEEFYRDYVGPSNSDIGFRPNFFPIALNLVEIESRQEEFVDLLTAGNTGISRARAIKAVYDLARYSRSIQNDDNATIEFDPLNPAKDAEESLVLTRGIDPAVLSDLGFLQEPQDALVNYMRSIIKRVEWNKATKDAEGNSILEQEMKKLSPEDQAIAREIIGTYLGYQTNPISPMWRKINSWGQFIQFVTILPFATIASLPELAGPVIASKEFSAVTEGFKQIIATIKNRKEAEQLARDIGVVSNETIANAWVTQAEQDYMDPTVRKLSDGFFRLIGLDFFTRFSREFAAGMGVQFITKHARNEFNNPRSERYLRELGLTKEDVMKWMEGGRKLTTPEGKKVKQALQRFVESSILRPNAAERPIWASDPHWALIWQLKSYFYAYSKVILGGIKREGQSRRDAGERAGPALATFALTAVVTMPLAMMAMELREYAKYGLAWLIPGIDASDKYFRTDRMDWPTYAFEVIDRSGFLGPLTIGAMMHQNAQWDKSPLMPLLGPTAETIDTALSNGWRIDRTLRDRLLPIYNQL